jgi:hypothetical protein
MGLYLLTPDGGDIFYFVNFSMLRPYRLPKPLKLISTFWAKTLAAGTRDAVNGYCHLVEFMPEDYFYYEFVQRHIPAP